MILENKLSEWFDLDSKSPYMGIVTKIKSEKKIINNKIQKNIGFDKINDVRSIIPAVTHVDYSARIQTVNGKYNKEIFALLKKFYEITNVPILVNTSFNLSNEPIVCNVLDAYKTFLTSDLEVLICGNCVIQKN